MTQDIISSTFHSRKEAEDAMHRLENVGVTDSQISIITKEETRDNFQTPAGETHLAGEGAAGGATAGGIAGAVLGALGSAAVIGVPGLNIVAAGVLGSTLAGLGTGAVTGGVVGGLVGAGISPDDAEVYKRELEQGAVLLTVHPVDSNQREKIHKVLGETEARHLAA